MKRDLFVVICIYAASATTAGACSCPQRSEDDLMSSHQVVFDGHVVDVEAIGEAGDAVRFTFAIDKARKGTVSKTITIDAGIHSPMCQAGATFLENYRRKMLIAGDPDPQIGLSVSGCSLRIYSDLGDPKQDRRLGLKIVGLNDKIRARQLSEAKENDRIEKERKDAAALEARRRLEAMQEDSRIELCHLARADLVGGGTRSEGEAIYCKKLVRDFTDSLVNEWLINKKKEEERLSQEFQRRLTDYNNLIKKFDR